MGTRKTVEMPTIRINLGDTIGGDVISREKGGRLGSSDRLNAKLDKENQLRLSDALKEHEPVLLNYLQKITPKGKRFIYFRDPGEENLEVIKRIGNYKILEETINYQHLSAGERVEKEVVSGGYTGSISSDGSVNISKDYGEVDVLYLDVNQYSDEQVIVKTYYFLVDESVTLQDFNNRFCFVRDYKKSYEQFSRTGGKKIGKEGKKCTIFNSFSLVSLLIMALFAGIQCTKEVALSTNALIAFGIVIYSFYVLLMLFKILFLVNFGRIKSIRKDIASKSSRFRNLSIAQLIITTMLIGLFTWTYFLTYNPEASNPIDMLKNIPFGIVVAVANGCFILELVNLIMWVKSGASDLSASTAGHDFMVDDFIRSGGVEGYERAINELISMVL